MPYVQYAKKLLDRLPKRVLYDVYPVRLAHVEIKISHFRVVYMCGALPKRPWRLESTIVNLQ